VPPAGRTSAVDTVGRIIDQHHPLWSLFTVLAAQRPQQKRQPGHWTTPRPLWHNQGRCADAWDLLAPIYGWFTEGFDMPGLKDAKALLLRQTAGQSRS
jgi:hypothetical protein